MADEMSDAQKLEAWNEMTAVRGLDPQHPVKIKHDDVEGEPVEVRAESVPVWLASGWTVVDDDNKDKGAVTSENQTLAMPEPATNTEPAKES